MVDVLVFEFEVPEDGCVPDDPPVADEAELPVDAFAVEPPVVVVDAFVLVVALAEPPAAWLVGVGDDGVLVLEPVVV